MNTRMDRIAALGGVAYVVRSMMAIFEAPLSDMDNVRRPAVRRTSRRREAVADARVPGRQRGDGVRLGDPPCHRSRRLSSNVWLGGY
jgi:hypothetical protein